MHIQNIGKSDGEYTLIPSKIGDDILCIKAVVPNTEQFNGAIYVPDSLHKNERMFWYEIVKEGFNVESKTGLKIGDYVFVDMLARYADTFPISFINVNGILFKTDSEGKSIVALKNRIIVKVYEPSEKKTESGLIQITDIDPYGEVVSIGECCEDRGVKIGDHIGMNSANDSATYIFRGDKYFDLNMNTPKFKFV